MNDIFQVLSWCTNGFTMPVMSHFYAPSTHICADALTACGRAAWGEWRNFSLKGSLVIESLICCAPSFSAPLFRTNAEQGSQQRFIIIRGNERKPKRKATPRKALMAAANVSVGATNTARNDPRYGQDTRRRELCRAASQGGGWQ